MKNLPQKSENTQENRRDFLKRILIATTTFPLITQVDSEQEFKKNILTIIEYYKDGSPEFRRDILNQFDRLRNKNDGELQKWYNNFISALVTNYGDVR